MHHLKRWGRAEEAGLGGSTPAVPQPGRRRQGSRPGAFGASLQGRGRGTKAVERGSPAAHPPPPPDPEVRTPCPRPGESPLPGVPSPHPRPGAPSPPLQAAALSSAPSPGPAAETRLPRGLLPRRRPAARARGAESRTTWPRLPARRGLVLSFPRTAPRHPSAPRPRPAPPAPRTRTRHPSPPTQPLTEPGPGPGKGRLHRRPQATAAASAAARCRSLLGGRSLAAPRVRSVRAEARLERSWRPRSLKLRPPSPGFSAARSPRPSRALVLDSELARTRPHPLRTMSMLGLDVRKLRGLPAKELILLPLLAQQSGGGPLLCARAGSKRRGSLLPALVELKVQEQKRSSDLQRPNSFSFESSSERNDLEDSGSNPNSPDSFTSLRDLGRGSPLTSRSLNIFTFKGGGRSDLKPRALFTT